MCVSMACKKSNYKCVVLLGSYAQVSIKLRNRGQDAYRPKEYGDCIIVERRISSDGSGSYKLKAKDGRQL